MISRRIFLKDGGLALVSLGFAPTFLARTVEGTTSRQKVMIAIFQRGAVDGLNMIIPFGEQDYYVARPTLAIARPGGDENAAVDLNGFFGMHPRMRPLKPLWESGNMAIVHACGSHDDTRSHFDAQDYMESAHAGRQEHDRRLDESVPARQGTPESDAVSRGGARTAAAAHAAGHRSGARHRADFSVRDPRRAGHRHAAGVVRSGVRRGRKQRPPLDGS